MRLPPSITQYFPIRLLRLVIISVAALLVLAPARLEASNTKTVTCWPTKLRFGDVAVGQTESLLVTVTNNGQASVTISAINVSGSPFSISPISLPFVLAPGQGVDVSVVFAPATGGAVGGNIAFVTSLSNGTVNLPVVGTGVTSDAVTASPTAVSFGQVVVGASTTAAVVLTNTRPWSVSLFALQTTGSGFSVSGPGFPLTLAAGASTTLNVSFAPQTVGLTGGSVFVFGPALDIPLTGTGTATSTVGQVTINPASLNFGNVAVGASETLSTTLSASGGSVTISSAASSNAQFVLSALSFPLTLSAGQSIPINVTFTPLSSGSTSGTVSFASNATNPSASESLAGTGTTPYVVLSWNPSTSSVSGYNIYRCLPASCSYTKVNSALDSNTTFTDTAVVSGQSYYYATTAVNSSGQESSYSNQVQVAVP